MVVVTKDPITPEAVAEKIDFPAGSGSIVLHLAVVKPEVGGKPTSGIRFEPSGDVEVELQLLESNIREDWPIGDIVLARRLGDLTIGDIISVAIVAAEGRESAFGACSDAVERFKRMKHLTKKELLD